MSPARPNSSFSFLHAADLHLDSPLTGLSNYPGAPAERLREATRHAFVKLVDLALEQGVSFVILAGDLFDGEWQDYSSGLWFLNELRRLTSEGVQTVIVRGNHDAESKIASRLSWPDGVTEFKSKRAHTLRLEDLQVALHGQSYGEQHVLDNLALGYPDALPDHFNIGVLHTGLEGYADHGHYAPCTLDDLRVKGYDYWALGHIHKREVLSESPWVVFPGNIQGRHIKETGPKGATLVRVKDGKVIGVEAAVCDVARWAHVVLDITGSASEAEVLLAIEAELRRVLGEAEGRLAAVRVELRGATVIDPQLRTESHRWEQEIRSRASGLSDDLWIEKLRVRTSPARGAAVGDDAQDASLMAFAERLSGAELPSEAVDSVARELMKLSAKLPPSVRKSLDPAQPGAVREALPEARSFLSALLQTGGPSPAVGNSSGSEH